MPIMVREAALDDAEGIARVHAVSWQAAYRGLVPDAVLDELTWQRRLEWWLATLAGRPDGAFRTLVAVDDGGTVVGFASVGPARDDDLDPRTTDELIAIYASPHAWGTGVGSALLRAVTDSQDPGTGEMVLWVLSGNERGRRFYERAGFTADGAVRDRAFGDVPLGTLRYRRGGVSALLDQ